MLASLIRKVSSLIYEHPQVPQNIPQNGAFGKLKIALLADYYTSICLSAECRVRNISPANYKEVILQWHPDLIFVESAFHGVCDEWRYKLQRQPFYLRSTGTEIHQLVTLARERNLPILFWNKDDKAFFDAFIDVACLFPYVFTTDADCLDMYKKRVPADTRVDFLGMAYQPAFHNFTGFHFKYKGACFVGSYYRKILKSRRGFLNMIFDATNDSRIPLHIYDRNSARLSHFFEFRFPLHSYLTIHPGLEYPDTANIYKAYTISLNVNSIIDSATMYSRRMLEILACGGICLTNSNPAVEKNFKEYCHIVYSAEEAREVLGRLINGPLEEDKDRAEAGARHVAGLHSWKHRLEELADKVNF